MDISKRSIGIAISDKNFDFIAHWYLIKADKRMNLGVIIHTHKPDLCIVGLPLDLGHTKSKNQTFVKEFTHSIRDLIHPYIFIDERFTSNLAERIKIINNSEKSIDELSASIMMERAFIMKNHIIKLYEDKNFHQIL